MELLASFEAFLFGDSRTVVDLMHAPAAIEAEDGDVGADAADASKCVDDDVANFSSAAEDGDLMDLINCAINGGDNDWV